MVICDNSKGKLEIVKHDADGTYTVRRTGEYRSFSLNPDRVEKIYAHMKASPLDIETYIENLCNGVEQADAPISGEAKLKIALEGLMNFLSEFNFTPSFRFVNTLCNMVQKSNTDGTDYVVNYFKLMDSPYAEEVVEKVKSTEFKTVIKGLAENAKPSKTINNRLKIYYGSQGTGKTTQALKETDYTIVCNSSMQPCDLIEDFTFDDGKASFHPSALVRCMQEGKPILLDEINLLPYDCLRFLQGICDGKESFEWKGNTIHIANGFSIVGTMNLTVNGAVFGLPEPLIDRCSDMKEFTLNADMLLGAI